MSDKERTGVSFDAELLERARADDDFNLSGFCNDQLRRRFDGEMLDDRARVAAYIDAFEEVRDRTARHLDRMDTILDELAEVEERLDRTEDEYLIEVDGLVENLLDGKHIFVGHGKVREIARKYGRSQDEVLTDVREVTPPGVTDDQFKPKVGYD